MISIKIINDDTGDDILGNYDYYVFVNEREVERGRIERHNRLTGMQGVIRLLAEAVSQQEKAK